MATPMDPNSNADFLNWGKLYEEKNSVEKEKDNLEKIYEKLLNKYTRNQVRLEDLNTENLKLKEENNQKDEKIRNFETENRGKQATIDSNKKRIEHLEQENENLKQQIENLQQQIENLQQQKENLEQKIDNLEQKIQEFEKDNEKWFKYLENSLELMKNDNNINKEKKPQHPPWIAVEFLRLVQKHIEPSLVGNLEVLEQSLFVFRPTAKRRLDKFKKRVISNARHDQELLQIVTAKFDELPSELFEARFSDFLHPKICPKLSFTNYESAVTEIEGSDLDEGIKKYALHATELLRDLYAKLGEPFGGNNSVARGDSLANTPRNCQKKSDSLESTPRKRQKKSE